MTSVSDVGLNAPPVAIGRFQGLPHRRWFVIGLCGLVCLGAFYLASIVWHLTWDDSAITLGYARTLAQDGTIRFGRYGERVEGFSTFLWMLVTAGLARFARTPEGLLEAAKLACAALYVLNGALCYRLTRRVVGAGWPPLAAALLFYGASMSITGITDAMESHLFAMLHLCVALAYIGLNSPPQKPTTGSNRPVGAVRSTAEGGCATLVLAGGLGLALVGLLLCRPEGVLGLGAVGLALVVERRRFAPPTWRWAAVAVVVAIACYAGFLVWRHWYFGAWLPNAVYAKMQPPYVDPFGVRLKTGAVQAGLFLLTMFGWMIVAVIGQAGPRRLARTAAEAVAAQPLLALTFAFFVLFHLAIGAQIGTANRSYVGVMPYTLVLVLSWVTRLRLKFPLRRLALCLPALLFWHFQAYCEYIVNPITIAHVRATNEPVIRLARMVADPPTVALPDMGATVLYWGQDVRLIDTALLNNARAAREGWGVMQDTVFADGPPDCIETHDIWTILSGLGQSPRVQANYELVTIDGQFYLLRRDHVARLLTDPPAGVRVRPMDTLTGREVIAARQTRLTDPLSGATRIDVPWHWAIELPPAKRPG